MKACKLGLAILWSLVAIGDITMAVGGQNPSWVHVFCPLVVVVFDSWADWLVSRNK